MLVQVAAGIVLPLQMAAADGTKVTDAKVLQSMGFAASTPNVFMAVKPARASAANTDATAGTPQTTPTTGTDYNAISAKEFIGRIDTTGTQWRYQGGPNCCVDLSRVGTELFADAQFELPTGATLTFFRYWAFDSNAADLAFFVFEVCQPAFAAGPPVINTIVSTATSGAPGNISNSVSVNRAVNNQTCTYLARVRFDAASTSLTLQKVRLQFNR
jgi:hypothetical protein